MGEREGAAECCPGRTFIFFPAPVRFTEKEAARFFSRGLFPEPRISPGSSFFRVFPAARNGRVRNQEEARLLLRWIIE